jgi:hypothetical protein
VRMEATTPEFFKSVGPGFRSVVGPLLATNSIRGQGELLPSVRRSYPCAVNVPCLGGIGRNGTVVLATTPSVQEDGTTRPWWTSFGSC